MNTSVPPYVGLFGSHSGDWRSFCKTKLDEAGIAWHDPTSDEWQKVNHENGDLFQDLVDQLVAEQHRALLGATCVIYHLAARISYRDAARAPNPKKIGMKTEAFAARCELGFLTGRGIPSLVHIEPDVVGRNYLWAQIKPYAHMVRCGSLAESVSRAIALMTACP